MWTKGIITGLAMSLSFATYAIEDLDPANGLPINWSPIITLSGGAAWATAGLNQYLYTYTYPVYSYLSYYPQSSSMATGEILFGLQTQVYPTIIGELGLGVAGATDGSVEGYEQIVNTTDSYPYQYQVNHARVELKGRIISNYYDLVQPYVSGSLGVGFNHAHDFRALFTSPTVVPPQWYANYTAVAFAYTVGAGLQTNINKNWQIGVGYQFADLGKSFLNYYSNGQVTAKGPKLAHFYTNEVVANLSYLF